MRDLARSAAIGASSFAVLGGPGPVKSSTSTIPVVARPSRGQGAVYRICDVSGVAEGRGDAPFLSAVDGSLRSQRATRKQESVDFLQFCSGRRPAPQVTHCSNNEQSSHGRESCAHCEPPQPAHGPGTCVALACASTVGLSAISRLAPVAPNTAQTEKCAKRKYGFSMRA